MALAQSSCNQRSVERIKFMVVDHDHAFLETLKHMLQSSIFRVSDSWGLECTVFEIGDSREALATLKTQRNNIDFIITDYDMPGMNGVQLKTQINQEFGDIPVMIMSSDIKNQEESLACGAIGFIQKPIDPSDVPTIFHFALTSKKKGKSKSTENNPKDKDVSVIPKQINLPPGPEQTDVLKIMDKKISSSESDSIPTNEGCVSLNEEKKGKSILSNEDKHKDKDVSVVSKQINLPPGPEQIDVLKIMDKKISSSESDSSPTNEGCVSPNGSSKDLKRNSDGGPSDDDESLTRPAKKTKIIWDPRLHSLFLDAIHHIGSDKAVPKNILEFMNEPNLTTKNIASHLQKYRMNVKKLNERKSSFLAAHTNPFTPTTYGSETSPTNSSLYSTLGHGLGQSRPNIHEPVHFNQMSPNNYMNQSSTHEPIGSESNSRFSEQAVNANKIGQTSQNLGFGLPGQSGISGNGFNNNMMSSYGPFTPNQPEPGNFSIGMQSFLNNENAAYNSHPHVNATAQPDLNRPQLVNPSLYGDLSNANEMLYNLNNFQVDHNKGHSNGETSNTFVVPETNPPSFDMNPNQNQGHSNGETMNTCVVEETYTPFFNMNPNQNQEQDNVPDFTCLSSLDRQELLGVDLTNSLFNNDMNWEKFS